MPEGGTIGRGTTPDGVAGVTLACPSRCLSRPPSARTGPGSVARHTTRSTTETVAPIAACFILRLSSSSARAHDITVALSMPVPRVPGRASLWTRVHRDSAEDSRGRAAGTRRARGLCGLPTPKPVNIVSRSNGRRATTSSVVRRAPRPARRIGRGHVRRRSIPCQVPARRCILEHRTTRSTGGGCLPSFPPARDVSRHMRSRP
jgi:hypothetical protein